jgi:Uma2 family endonuclease
MAFGANLEGRRYVSAQGNPMTLHVPQPMSKEAFFAWVERHDQRFKYSGGRAVMMVRVTRNHSVVTKNLIAALTARLDFAKYDVAAESFAVEAGDSVRFPDVVIEPAQSDGHALEAKAPILIAEVLSPGTLHLDFGVKQQEYLSLPTLDVYVVAAADEPRLWVWRRANGAFPPEPEIIEGVEQTLALPTLGIDLPLRDIFRGVR